MHIDEIYNKYFQELSRPEEYKKGMFIEVAGGIRKLSVVPQAGGSFEEIFIPWQKESLYRNYGKDFTKDVIFKDMPVLDGETLIPDHLNYQPVIGRYLNTYHPLKYQPIHGANWIHIEKLFQHIFGDQYELGLDYFQLLYTHPMQHLPLLLLVSTENQTGKSTFCNFIKKVFGQNVTGVNSEGLRNRFTSTWMNKLVVYVEEQLLNREGDGDLIKNLVTAFFGQSEAKGKDRTEIPLFAKLIMTSNNIFNPIIIREDDTRVWVRQVPPLPPRIPGSPDFLEECEKEIPYFLDFICNREISIKCEDRLWFRHERIVTDAWRKIVNFCRSSIEKQAVELMLSIMENCQVEVLRFSNTDLLSLLKLEGIKVDRPAITQLLKERWKMTSPTKGRYDRYLQDFNHPDGFRCTSTTGRFYTFEKDFLQKLTV